MFASLLITAAGFLALQAFGDGIQLRAVTRTGSDLSVSFDAMQNVTYRLERKIDITDAKWQSIPALSDLISPNNGVALLTDSGAFNLGKAFYRVRQVGPCDAGLASNSSDALDYAKAIELCDTTTDADTTSGVISAQLTLASGSGTPAVVSRSIRPSFGTSNFPVGGNSMIVLSTGAAASKLQTNPSFQAFQPGLDTGTTSAAPADWLAANNGTFPNAPGCAAPQGTAANNSVMLTLRVRVPSYAHSFRVSMKFFSAEYPEWVCSPYNDLFVALLDSTFAGTPANPSDKNIAVYIGPNSGKYPIGVNLANVGFFTECLNGATGCASGANAGSNSSCTGTTGIDGTGMDDTASGFQSGCGTSNKVGGGTDWLFIRGNVVPGETITLRFAIWDTSDAILDSVALLDNFAWSADTITPGVSLN